MLWAVLKGYFLIAVPVTPGGDHVCITSLHAAYIVNDLWQQVKHLLNRRSINHIAPWSIHFDHLLEASAAFFDPLEHQYSSPWICFRQAPVCQFQSRVPSLLDGIWILNAIVNWNATPTIHFGCLSILLMIGALPMDIHFPFKNSQQSSDYACRSTHIQEATIFFLYDTSSINYHTRT